jgi:outer membrane protein TolC
MLLRGQQLIWLQSAGRAILVLASCATIASDTIAWAKEPVSPPSTAPAITAAVAPSSSPAVPASATDDDGPVVVDLTFDQVLEKAILNARDVQIADLDMRISKERVGEEKADYYPQITGRWNSAYLRTLGDNAGPAISVSAGGSNLLFNQTQYQNVPSLNAQITLLDFGIRKRKVKSAREDIDKFAQQRLEKQRDVALKALDAYEDALEAYQTSQMQSQLMEWARDVLKLKQRLYEAGYSPKTEVADAGYRVAQTLDEMESTRNKLSQALVDLGFLTKDRYEPGLTTLTPLSEQEALDDEVTLVPEQLPEFKRYEHEKAKKRMEIEISHRERWAPKITGFTNYTLFGAAASNVSDAVTSITQRNLYIGVSAQLPIFEGFKSRHEANRLTLELERLGVEQSKAVEQTLYQLERAKREAQVSLAQLPGKEAIVTEANNKEVMLQRLSQQQLVERTQVLTQAITRQRAAMEARKLALTARAAQKRQQLLTIGAS